MLNIKSRRAFTLIELLVVISIIAVLMAIMMPALRAAKRQAQKSVCISNMRQQANAQFAFAADNNGRFPAHGDILPNYLLSPDRRAGHDYDSKIYDSMQDGYFGDGEVFVCPATKQFANKNPLWLGYYADASWYQPTQISGWWYGGWNAEFTSGGNPTRAVREVVYNWYANFKPRGLECEFERESDRWPSSIAECTSTKGFISHNIVRTSAGFYDYSHGGDPTVFARSLADTKSSDNPVCYSDGHIKTVKKSQMRMISTYTNESGQELDVYY
jgi:prepilin-type N-terminal cleavage/methylation domain-containing protein